MQTSYSVDRAGTAEQEAEAAVEAPKRVRRTREQIEQDKIDKAQARLAELTRQAKDRRLYKASSAILDAVAELQPGDISQDTIDALEPLRASITGNASLLGSRVGK